MGVKKMENKNHSIVGIYTRVSTNEQRENGHSLEAQEKILKEYAKRKNLKIYDIYTDGGESGRNFERPALKRLIQDLKDKKLDTILVHKVDRLSRNNKDVLNLIDDILTPNNQRVLVSSGDIDSSTTNGYMFISLLGTFARYERETIIDRVKIGMQKRAEEGKYNGGKMLGYDSVEGQLIINPVEAKIVKQIFEFRSKYWGYKKIANFLNDRGEKTKNNNNFSIESIKTILNNQRYVGINFWGKHKDWTLLRRKGKSEPIKNKATYEAIIDKQLWDKVQKINYEQKRSYSSNRNFNGNFFLSGVLKCPMCGASMVMHKTKNYKGDGYHLYYMCQQYHTKGRNVCKTNLVKKEWIEEKVLIIINSLVLNQKLIDKVIMELKQNDFINVGEFIKNIEILKLELESLKQRQEEIDNEFKIGNLNISNYNRLIASINKDIDEREKRIRKLNQEVDKNSLMKKINNEFIYEVFKNFKKAFVVATDEDKKMLVRSLIKEIHVTEDRKDIKDITFWFFNTDNLPSNPIRRTVS
jgi:site-specific DNA recombinase